MSTERKDPPWVTCTCGKRGYHSRANAKVVRRRTAPHLSVYRCPLDASLYHVGHMPKGASRAGARASALRRAGKATPPAHGGGAASGVD